MRNIHETVPTEEAKEKKIYPTAIAEFSYSSTYTTSDCLNPSSVAKKYGISTKTAREIMHRFKNTNKYMLVNGHKRPIIINIKGKHGPFLHPLATSIFEKYLQKIKG